jgi:hypothetical protein
MSLNEAAAIGLPFDKVTVEPSHHNVNRGLNDPVVDVVQEDALLGAGDMVGISALALRGQALQNANERERNNVSGKAFKASQSVVEEMGIVLSLILHGFLGHDCVSLFSL